MHKYSFCKFTLFILARSDRILQRNFAFGGQILRIFTVFFTKNSPKHAARQEQAAPFPLRLLSEEITRLPTKHTSIKQGARLAISSKYTSETTLSPLAFFRFALIRASRSQNHPEKHHCSVTWATVRNAMRPDKAVTIAKKRHTSDKIKPPIYKLKYYARNAINVE